MKRTGTSNFLKKIITICFIIYFIYTFISQQKTLNAYAKEEENYNKEIAASEEERNELQTIKDNVNSNEYIEQIAREKLGMYYPNERVYVDIEK